METLDRTMNMKIIVQILGKFPSGNVRKRPAFEKL